MKRLLLILAALLLAASVSYAQGDYKPIPDESEVKAQKDREAVMGKAKGWKSPETEQKQQIESMQRETDRIEEEHMEEEEYR